MLVVCDAWFLGDLFLCETFPALQAIKAQAIESNSVLPFLQEYYNTIPLFASANSYNTSFLARILNELIDKMNIKVRLLKYVLMCLDKDVIKNLKQNNFAILQLIEVAVNRLAKQIEIVMDLRRVDLKAKNPGALWSSNELRLVWIWVKMITRPFT